MLAIPLGIFLGCITGLIPGIHVNLVALGLVAGSSFLLRILAPIEIAELIVAMGITHTFIDVIPAVFLGAPSSDTALLTLPAHRMLNRGLGYSAIRLATFGGLLSLAFLVVLSPLLYFLIKFFYPWIGHAMGYILVVFIAFFIFRSHKRLIATLIFLLSGTLGLLVLNSPHFKQPMLPMLTGLFGMSLLIHSLFCKTHLPMQSVSPELFVPSKLKSTSAACLGGVITGIFPGVGAAQAAIIGRTLAGRLTSRAFIMLNGGVNTVNFFVSLFTLHIIGKARNGAVLGLQHYIAELSFIHLLLLICVALFAGGIAAFFSLYLSRKFCKWLGKLDYGKISFIVIAFLFGLTFVFSGGLGIIVLLVSTAIGILPHYIGIGKSHCMGCILIPVAVYFLI